MATILATCDHCGDVEVTVAEVRVRAGDGAGRFSFDCPYCGRVWVRSIEARTVDLLIAAGASFEPAPRRPASPRTTGSRADAAPGDRPARHWGRRRRRTRRPD